MELEPEQQYKMSETLSSLLKEDEDTQHQPEAAVETEKRKNGDSQNSGGLKITFIVTRTGGIILIILISFVLVRLVDPNFDPFNLLNGNGCIINLFGTCNNGAGGDSTPTDTPTPVASTSPAPIVNKCTAPGLPPVQNSQIKFTVNSVDIRIINVNLKRLAINVTVENLTNSDLVLEIDGGNLWLGESSTSEVLAGPIMDTSIWTPELRPLSKSDMSIVVYPVKETSTSIDMEFINSRVGGKVESGIRINGVPSTC